ncbi:MAG: glycosyltransferase family 2 protein [Coriobacteriales bacterium]|nr:glycosyltransferase family 2 protein [Coriobacteriales bacterium]
MAKLSVVVPVYNVEDYVGECLESICSQDFSDLEIICVNDGSTDGSREVVSSWQERDGRIVIVDQPNKGLSAARNTGIAMASGDVLCFVDSDDKLEPGACARLADEFAVEGTEAVVFGARTFPNNTSDEWLKQTLSPRTVRYDRFDPKVLFSEASTPYVWRVAVAAESLHRIGLKFDASLKFGEDQLFLFCLYPQLSGIQLISDKLYAYRINRPGSLMNRTGESGVEKVEKNLVIAERIFAYWQAKGFARRWPVDLLDWSVKFLLYSILCQEHAARVGMTQRLVALWERCLPAYRELALRLPSHARAMVDLACAMAGQGAFPSERRIKTVMVRYRFGEYGAVSFMSSLINKTGLN